MIEGKEVLIIGGTGSLGSVIVKKLLKNHKCKGIRIFSRSEKTQLKLKNEIKQLQGNNNVAWFIGDIRDYDRLELAMRGVDIVFQTAAIKQVPTCEENPIEAIKTNIDGAVNVITAATKTKPSVVVNISTDKAVYPVNLYGCTKAVAEKLYSFASIYTPGKTKFISCRYGNVFGSDGSIYPEFKKQIDKDNKVTLTHPEMTRFFMSIQDVAQFVIDRSQDCQGGEIFIPKMKGINIKQFIKTVFGDIQIEVIGIRKSEKIDECLITKEESIFIEEKDTYYILNVSEKNIKNYDEKYFLTSAMTKELIKEDIDRMIEDLNE